MYLEKKKINKKIIISSIIVSIVLIGVVGVTFAIWSYSKVGPNQELISGNIYMKYTETNQINAQGMMPLDINNYYGDYKVNPNMTEEELASCESFFEENFSQMFQNEETTRAFCEGTGTASGLTFQGVLDGGYLNGNLEELVSKNIIIREFIPQPTETSAKIPYFEFNIEGTNDYTKDIWYEIVLSHGEAPEDRDTRIKDYLLRFRLVEVVNGIEKEIFTNRNYGDLSKEKIWVDTVSARTEEIKRVYRLYMWIGNETTIGNIEGADYDNETWKRVFASIKVNVNGDFTPKKILYIPYVKDPETVPPQNASCFMTQEFEHNGDTEIMITNYDTDCGTKVNIPSTINGHKVTVIGSAIKSYNEGYIQPMAFSEGEWSMSFSNKGLISVVIPNTVRIIGVDAFSNNNLTKVEIPDSVEWIDSEAFEVNQLEEVTIGSGIKYIGGYVFDYNGVNSITRYGTFKTLKVKKSCEEIKKLHGSFEEQDTYSPWAQPTHKDGLTIYGYEDNDWQVCVTQIIAARPDVE